MIKRWTVCMLLALAACGEEETAENFQVMSSDLQDFRSWPSYVLNDGTSEVHRGFLNKAPASGDGSFAKGTIIIKTEEPSDDISTWAVYGMVKRGPGYNQAGAIGWEWLELKPKRSGRGWDIDWRGVEPPNGASYRCVEQFGPSAPDCNACHASKARQNDFVISEALQLHRF